MKVQAKDAHTVRLLKEGTGKAVHFFLGAAFLAAFLAGRLALAAFLGAFLAGAFLATFLGALLGAAFLAAVALARRCRWRDARLGP